MDSALRVAIASGVFSLAAVIATFGLPYLSKRRAVRHRETLQSVRQDADRLDGAFNRLEKENKRLYDQLRDLRVEVAGVVDTLKLEREAHKETRDRCARHEKLLRMLGHGGKLDGEGQ